MLTSSDSESIDSAQFFRNSDSRDVSRITVSTLTLNHKIPQTSRTSQPTKCSDWRNSLRRHSPKRGILNCQLVPFPSNLNDYSSISHALLLHVSLNGQITTIYTKGSLWSRFWLFLKKKLLIHKKFFTNNPHHILP